MNRALLVVVLLLAGGGIAWAGPTGINILSQTYHIGGYAGFTGAEGGYHSYDLTSPNPLSASVTSWSSDFGYDYYEAGSRTGFFGVSAYAERWYSRAVAESTYVFQMEDDSETLTFSVHGWRSFHYFESAVELTLKDLTTGTILENYVDSGPYDEIVLYTFAWTGVYTVDPAHIYSLRLYAWADGGDSWADTFLAVSITVPGAMTLGMIGTGLVGWCRRRKAAG